VPIQRGAVVYLVNSLLHNFPHVPLKKMRKSVNIWRRCGQKFGAHFWRATL